MKKLIALLALFICFKASVAQPGSIKVCELPEVTDGTVHDYLIKEDSTCVNGTRKITVENFLSFYGIGSSGFGLYVDTIYLNPGGDSLIWRRAGILHKVPILSTAIHTLYNHNDSLTFSRTVSGSSNNYTLDFNSMASFGVGSGGDVGSVGIVGATQNILGSLTSGGLAFDCPDSILLFHNFSNYYYVPTKPGTAGQVLTMIAAHSAHWVTPSGGRGSVSISNGYGIINSPNPITGTGSTTWDSLTAHLTYPNWRDTISVLETRHVVDSLLNHKTDTIYRTAGKDSIQFLIGGRYHAIKDSIGGGGAVVPANQLYVGSGTDTPVSDATLQKDFSTGEFISNDASFNGVYIANSSGTCFGNSLGTITSFGAGSIIWLDPNSITSMFASAYGFSSFGARSGILGGDGVLEGNNAIIKAITGSGTGAVTVVADDKISQQADDSISFTSPIIRFRQPSSSNNASDSMLVIQTDGTLGKRSVGGVSGTSISQGNGVIATPNPITSAGTIKLDTVSVTGSHTIRWVDSLATKKLNISDTTGMLSARFARDTVSLSNRINLKLNLSDSASMLSSRIHRDTISLSNRINSVVSSDALKLPVDGSANGATVQSQEFTNGILVNGIRQDQPEVIDGVDATSLSMSTSQYHKVIVNFTAADPSINSITLLPSPVDGQEVVLIAFVDINGLSISGAGGETMSYTPDVLRQFQSVRYVYKNGATEWYYLGCSSAAFDTTEIYNTAHFGYLNGNGMGGTLHIVSSTTFFDALATGGSDALAKINSSGRITTTPYSTFIQPSDTSVWLRKDDNLGALTSASTARTNLGLGALATVNPASGISTWLTTPSSANLISAMTDETGTGALVFANTPTLITPILGTPTSGTLTNVTGLPLTSGVTGTLPYANGGTGGTSFTNHGAVVAGASALSTIAPGTTGNVLTSNGTDWTSSAISVSTSSFNSGTNASSATFLRGDGIWSDSINRNNITTTATLGLQLRNNTPSLVGTTVQWSPYLSFLGHAWKTSGVDSVEEFRIQLTPISAASPSARLDFNYFSGSATSPMTLTSAGFLTCLSQITSNSAINATTGLNCTNSTATLNIGNGVSTYRLANNASDITADGAFSTSTVTAGTWSIFLDRRNTGGLVFTQANGTRQIARAAIKDTSTSSSAATENGTLLFQVMKNGVAPATKAQLDSIGCWSVGTSPTNAAGWIHTMASTAAIAAAVIDSGTTPSPLVKGQVYSDGSNLHIVNGTPATDYTLQKALLGSATLDFANQAAIGCNDLTITVTGAADGDPVELGVPNGSVPNGTSTFTAWVSAANTVTVRYCQLVSGDPASGTFKVRVIK